MKNRIISEIFKVDSEGVTTKVKKHTEVAKKYKITATSVGNFVKEWKMNGSLKEDRRIGNTQNRVLSKTHE